MPFAFSNSPAVCFPVQEKDKYNQMALKSQKDVTELQAALTEEGQNRLQLQLELDSKESEIEALQLKLALNNSDTASVNSGPGEEDEALAGMESNPIYISSIPLELSLVPD